ASGDHDGALELLMSAALYSNRVGAHLFTAFVLFDVAEAAVGAGRPDVLQIALATLAAVDPADAAPGQLAVERVARGALGLAVGDAAAAVDDLRAGCDVFDQTGWVMHAGRVRVMLARALAAVDRDAAVDALRAASEQFAAAGAQRRYDEALDAMTVLAG